MYGQSSSFNSYITNGRWLSQRGGEKKLSKLKGGNKQLSVSTQHTVKVIELLDVRSESSEYLLCLTQLLYCSFLYAEITHYSFDRKPPLLFYFFPNSFQEKVMAAEAKQSCYEGSSVQSFQFYLEHSGEQTAVLQCVQDILPREFKR